MNENDELLQLFEDVRGKHSKAVAAFREDNNLIKGEFGEHIIPDDTEDEGLEVTKPPTVYNAVENAKDHILTNPRILVPSRPSEDGHEAEKVAARKRQQFLEMWWNRVAEEHGDPLARMVKSLIKGKGVLKVTIDWNLLPGVDDMGDDEYAKAVRRVTGTKFIWRVDVPPKETVFEVGDPWDPDGVFEAYDITARQIRRSFPKIADAVSDRRPSDKVRYIEYWEPPAGSSRGKFIQWVDDLRVHEGINPYSWESPISTPEKPDYEGYVPYAIGDPGWGDVDADGNPEDRYWSIIRPIRSVAVAEARMLTSMEAFLRTYVWPVILKYGYPADSEDKVGPGQVWNLPQKGEGQEIDVLRFPELPIGLLQGMDRVNRYADEAAKFGILGGQSQPGVDTATEADQHLRNAATKLAGPVRAVRRMIQIINRWVLMDIEQVLESPVTIWGATKKGDAAITLSPKEIDGAYFTQVELDTADEAALSTRMLRMWADIAQRMPVPARFVFEQGGVTDPDAMVDEWETEQLERGPQAQQIKTQWMLMRMAEQYPEVNQILAAWTQQLASGVQSQPEQGAQPQMDQMGDPIEQMRRQARDEAIQNQPELAYQ